MYSSIKSHIRTIVMIIWLLSFLLNTLAKPRYLFLLLGIYEYTLARCRKQNLIRVYREAVKRASFTNKKLLLIGEIPDTNDDIGNVQVISLSSKDIDIQLSDLAIDDYVVMESYVFEKVPKETFRNIEVCLRTKSPADIFFVHMQPYSIITWLCPFDDKEAKQISKRVFLFHPPSFKFVYAVDNPFVKYEKFIVPTVGIVMAFSTCLSIWNR